MEDVKIARPTATVPEYARLTKSTARKVKTLCENNILPAYRTKGGHWRILLNGNFVPREMYEEALQKISRLESRLKSVKNISEII